MPKNPIALVDSDYDRCAEIVSALTSRGRIVEAYENLSDFSQRRHDRQIIMVHDEGGLIKDVIEWCQVKGQLVCTVGYSEQPDPKSVVMAIRLGAIDYCSWPFDSLRLNEVLDSIGSISAKEWDSLERLNSARKSLSKLTSREKEILLYISEGLSNKEIAQDLNISIRTVEVHRTHLICKIGAANSFEAVRIAIEAGLRRLPDRSMILS